MPQLYVDVDEAALVADEWGDATSFSADSDDFAERTGETGIVVSGVCDDCDWEAEITIEPDDTRTVTAVSRELRRKHRNHDTSCHSQPNIEWFEEE